MPRYFLHQLRMLADRLRDRHEDHAGLLQLLLEGGRDRDRIEHGIDRDAALAFGADHAGQHFLLAQWNAEFFVGPENLRIDLVERGQFLLLRRRVVIEVLIVDLRIMDARPLRLLHGQPAAIGLQPPLQHPGRLVLLCGNEADGIFRQPARGLVGLDKRLKSISILVDVDPPDAIDRLLDGWHSFPPLAVSRTAVDQLQSLTLARRRHTLRTVQALFHRTL